MTMKTRHRLIRAVHIFSWIFLAFTAAQAMDGNNKNAEIGHRDGRRDLSWMTVASDLPPAVGEFLRASRRSLQAAAPDSPLGRFSKGVRDAVIADGEAISADKVAAALLQANGQPLKAMHIAFILKRLTEIDERLRPLIGDGTGALSEDIARLMARRAPQP
ncbi:MAG TPA: hypothetical protein VHL08_09495 [Dongiaceae bacterium]|jgi:hypothetical protein|nr:hypothetical protein [Dongiaceae bacterium]